MTTLEILKAARALIATPDKWTKRCGARDKFSEPVPTLSPKANSYCAGGALYRVLGGNSQTVIEELAFDTSSDVLGFDYVEDLIDFNDAPETTHEMVLARFDAAIARLEAQP